MDPKEKVRLILEHIGDHRLDLADEHVDDLWYWVKKRGSRPTVTQEEFDKITSQFHSMKEVLLVDP